MSPGEIAKEWLAAFNRGDLEQVMRFYHADANIIDPSIISTGPNPYINPEEARLMFADSIEDKEKYENGYILADDVCAVIVYCDNSDYSAGCICFHVIDGLIKVQRFYR